MVERVGLVEVFGVYLTRSLMVPMPRTGRGGPMLYMEGRLEGKGW